MVTWQVATQIAIEAPHSRARFDPSSNLLCLSGADGCAGPRLEWTIRSEPSASAGARAAPRSRLEWPGTLGVGASAGLRVLMASAY